MKTRKLIGGGVLIFMISWCLFLLFLHSSLLPPGSDAVSVESLLVRANNKALQIPKKEHQKQRQQQDLHIEVAAAAAAADPRANNNNIKNIDNPWYGWQPEIASAMECSWRKCFEPHHGCRTCRDGIEDIGVVEAPQTPEHNWVPDVTMLRRMWLDGHDALGKPWPPPLDDELCESIGTFGGSFDNNRQLLDAVPIVAHPFSEIKGQPKILCLVYTMETEHATRVRAIRETWAPGCDGFLAFSTNSDPRIPAISLPHDGPEEYNNMWQKVRSIWSFVAQHYLEDFDFFYIGGDDLFVMPQNLRNYLATVSKDEDHFLGRRFKAGGKDNYFNSGGAGYALSRSTLQKFASVGLEHLQCNPLKHTAMEDVMVAECLRKVFNISFEDTRDEQGRERFHPFSPGGHYNWRHPKPGKTDWYENYNAEWGLKLGAECCAPDSVSFHYIKKPATVRHLHHLLYGCNKNVVSE
jgi:glycoprotein-N-acetylgalactosamine 3-beta-galactosyltransferase